MDLEDTKNMIEAVLVCSDLDALIEMLETQGVMWDEIEDHKHSDECEIETAVRIIMESLFGMEE